MQYMRRRSSDNNNNNNKLVAASRQSHSKCPKLFSSPYAQYHYIPTILGRDDGPAAGGAARVEFPLV
jgi:hypothetical protein